MESIYPVLALPKPLDSQGGRTRVQAVVSFSSGRKRKRSEIAAAVDGDSLNIYKLQPTSLVLTHALAPQIRCTSAPCSVYSKQKSGNVEIRRTYVTTVDGTDDKTTLSCFEDSRVGLEPPVSRKVEHTLASTSPVLALTAVQGQIATSPKYAKFELLVAQQDGTLSAFADDLGEPLWSTIITPLGSTTPIENIVITNAQDFKSGFLRDREDVLAQLLGVGSTDLSNLAKIPVIILTARDASKKLCISILAMRAQQAIHFGLEEPVQSLLDFELKLPQEKGWDKPLQCSWSIPTGMLYIRNQSSVMSYDLTGYAPQLLAALRLPGANISTHYATTSALILVQQGHQLTLYDTKHNSIQDRKLLPADSKTTNKKRKRSAEETDLTPLSFIDHFSKLGIILALHDNNLVAIQLTRRTSKQLRGLHDSRLIDSLQKGSWNAQSFEPLHNGTAQEIISDVDSADWLDTRRKILDCVAGNDVEAFDQEFATCLGAQSAKTSENGSQQWSWTQHGSSRQSNQHRLQALFALNCIFAPLNTESAEPNTATNENLSIHFFPPNTFQWLTESGQMTTVLIQQAFLNFSTESYREIAKQELVDAIVQLDPSLEVLCGIVKHSPHLEIEDLVQCIKHIIASFDSSVLPAPQALIASEDEALAITNGSASGVPNGFNPHEDIPNGFESHDNTTNGTLANGDIDYDVDAEVEDAIEDVDMALDDLQDDRSRRGEALSRCLTRLNAHSSVAVTHALRRGLNQHEIIFLIHLLRVELAEGGWLSRYFDKPDHEEQDVYNQSVRVVLSLINCTLDAIGIAGFLAASASDPSDSIDELLSSLQAEHAAGMEGLNEAQFVNGALNTFLRFARRLKGSQYRPADKAIQILKPASNELPLGLKVEELSKTKKAANGQVVERSKRDIGRQISMRVPLYSIERIRV